MNQVDNDPTTDFRTDTRGLSAFIGQKHITSDLQSRVQEAIHLGQPLPHMVFIGPDEMGKATLATKLSEDLGVSIKIMNPEEVPSIEDMAAILTNMETQDILFVENIEAFDSPQLKILRSAVSHSTLNLSIGKGPSERSISLQLPAFTLIGSSASPSRVDDELLRWLLIYDFRTYSPEELAGIIFRQVHGTHFTISKEAAHEIAQTSDPTPGAATDLAKRVMGYCEKYTSYKITTGAVREAFRNFRISINPTSSVEIADALAEMDGDDFEDYCAKVLRKSGFQVEMTAGSSDHGVDLVLVRDTERIAVQCKRWSQPIGEPILRDFLGAMMHSGFDKGMILTTSHFTEDAKVFAEDKPIKLVDLDGLVYSAMERRVFPPRA